MNHQSPNYTSWLLCDYFFFVWQSWGTFYLRKCTGGNDIRKWKQAWALPVPHNRTISDLKVAHFCHQNFGTKIQSKTIRVNSEISSSLQKSTLQSFGSISHTFSHKAFVSRVGAVFPAVRFPQLEWSVLILNVKTHKSSRCAKF